MTRRHIPSAAAAALLLLLLAACGGGDDATVAGEAPAEEATEDATEDAGEPATEEATEEATAPDAAMEDVKGAPAEAPDAPPAPAPQLTPAPVRTLTPAETPQPEAMVEAMDSIAEDMGTSGATSYDSYTVISDDTGAILVEVPAEWADVDGRPYSDEQGRQLFDVRASTDLEAFAGTWDVPGIIVTASREVAETENEVTLLDEAVGPLSQACTYLGRSPYDDGLYFGQVDVYDACGGTESGYVVLGVVPANRAFVIRIQVQVVEERDLEALVHALDSFVVVGDV